MSLGTLQAPNNSGNESACSNCNNILDPTDPVCRHCGYYAKLNTFVEIDEMDKYYSKGEYHLPEPEDAHQNEYVKAFKAIPVWAWKLCGVVFLVSLLILALAAITPVNTALRIVVGVGTVVLGLLIAVTAHAVAGVRVVREEFELGGWDIFISPFRIWRHVLMRLPKLFGCAATGVGGAWAVIMAHLVIGIPYWEMMWAGEPPPKKKKPMASMVAGMAGSAASEEESMEEAMKDFAGDSAGGEEEEDEDRALTLQQAIQEVWRDAFEDNEPGVISEEDAEKLEQTRRVKLRALTIGVKQDEEGKVMALIVAIKNNGKWEVAGAVSKGLSDEVKANIRSQIDSLRRDEPFVSCRLKATWIEPLLYCNIEADYTPSEEKFGKISLLGVD